MVGVWAVLALGALANLVILGGWALAKVDGVCVQVNVTRGVICGRSAIRYAIASSAARNFSPGFFGADVLTFDYNPPLSLGAYTLHSFDPNGTWYIWEKRADWDKTAMAQWGEPGPKFVIYRSIPSLDRRLIEMVNGDPPPIDIASGLDGGVLASALAAAGGYAYPASQTPWQEIQRALVDQLECGMVLKPAVKYQRVAQSKGIPRDNH